MAFELFVNGGLMRGLSHHANMEGAEFLEECATVPRYRLYSIDDLHPGMFEIEDGGVSIAGELYRVPDEVWWDIEIGEPPDLYRGSVQLADGRDVFGVLYPQELAEHRHRDISAFGGWRAYLAAHPPESGA